MADGEYVCSLDASSLKKAKLELYEESKDRLSALQTFREWIGSQKWLKTPTGSFALFVKGPRESLFHKINEKSNI